MKIKAIGYWVATALIALETLAGGVADLIHGRTELFSGPRAADVLTSLGYPVYVLTILGIWKIPGAIILVVPRFLRLKEWAYAGIVFELSGAAASLAVRGHRSDLVAPLVLLGLALASWAFRPSSRILGAVSPTKKNGRDFNAG
jgi:DoxX-like family